MWVGGKLTSRVFLILLWRVGCAAPPNTGTQCGFELGFRGLGVQGGEGSEVYLQTVRKEEGKERFWEGREKARLGSRQNSCTVEETGF